MRVKEFLESLKNDNSLDAKLCRAFYGRSGKALRELFDSSCLNKTDLRYSMKSRMIMSRKLIDCSVAAEQGYLRPYVARVLIEYGSTITDLKQVIAHVAAACRLYEVLSEEDHEILPEKVREGIKKKYNTRVNAAIKKLLDEEYIILVDYIIADGTPVDARYILTILQGIYKSGIVSRGLILSYMALFITPPDIMGMTREHLAEAILDHVNGAAADDLK